MSRLRKRCDWTAVFSDVLREAREPAEEMLPSGGSLSERWVSMRRCRRGRARQGRWPWLPRRLERTRCHAPRRSRGERPGRGALRARWRGPRSDAESVASRSSTPAAEAACARERLPIWTAVGTAPTMTPSRKPAASSSQRRQTVEARRNEVEPASTVERSALEKTSGGRPLGEGRGRIARPGGLLRQCACG